MGDLLWKFDISGSWNRGPDGGKHMVCVGGRGAGRHHEEKGETRILVKEGSRGSDCRLGSFPMQCECRLDLHSRPDEVQARPAEQSMCRRLMHEHATCFREDDHQELVASFTELDQVRYADPHFGSPRTSGE